MLTIKSVEKNSIAERLKLNSGDKLIKINDVDIVDILDMSFAESKESFLLSAQKKNGKAVSFKIKKDIDEELGINFIDENYLTPRSCSNNCMFCFVDQLPNNMRDTLYIKDDDYRLSFVSGNFVTLTNLTRFDIERIKEKRFSPLYISVHSTDDELRKKMIGCDYDINIMDILKEFNQADIAIHCQIVLCPNLNDGEVLAKTLSDLYSLRPSVKSVAIVPVGLTKFRQNLAQIDNVDTNEAKRVIETVEAFANESYKNCGSHFAYCSDEFYIKADLDLPNFEYYENFDQIENGVGLLAKFKEEFLDAMKYCVEPKKESFTIISGKSAEKFLNNLIFTLKNKFSTLNYDIINITNNFFGTSITVSGLVVGADILQQLKGTKLNDTIVLPRCMLKEFEDVFLDGTSLIDLERELGRKILVIDVDGYSLVEALTQGE